MISDVVFDLSCILERKVEQVDGIASKKDKDK